MIFAAIGRFFWALLGSKAMLYSVVLLAVLAGGRVWLWQHDSKVSDKAVQKIDTQAKVLTKEAVKAREAANKPGSDERLRKTFCRDC